MFRWSDCSGKVGGVMTVRMVTLQRDKRRPAVPATRLWWRFPLLVAAIASMAVGIWGGLVRLGWDWAVPGRAVVDHGAIMIGGFLGTLLGLERAVALGLGWCYLGPAATAAGAILLLAGVPTDWGASLIWAGSGIMVIDFVFILWRQAAVFTSVMAAGAAAWMVGNTLWLAGKPIYLLVWWWMAFLVLTIVGERLELSRLLPQSLVKRATFLVAAGILVLGMLVTLRAAGLGEAMVGADLVALAAWLLVYDVAGRTVRQTGLTRFVAVCLLTGYLFLGIGGVLAVLWAGALPLAHGRVWMGDSLQPGLAYDAVLHAVFLGFVFAMIFGHAPIIFPAVLRVRIIFSPRFYLHLVLLEGSVAWRLACDMSGAWSMRQWAGMLNGLAILLFLANTVASIRRRVDESPLSIAKGLT